MGAHVFDVVGRVVALENRVSELETLLSAVIGRLQAEPGLRIDYTNIRTNPFTLNDKPKPQL